jgi:hypothetical protein|tara:strand:- start:6815 stop:7897 length:1083 start_codon:yes stop_codon:yes gene_type:complete
MGNKYLETKNDTLESSILDVWKDAAKLDEYKTRLGEKKRVSGGDNRRTENKQPKEEGLESSPNAANSQHLCAKNVVHEDWGEGQPVHGMHAIPNSGGDIAWYDVMFEHGVEKGVSINELKITKSESHHNHDGNGGKKKKKEEAELNEDNLDLMRKAAGGAKQTLKMKDGKIGVDSFSASAIMQIYDKINDKNKKTFENMMKNGKKADIVKLMKFAMSKVNASYEEFEEEFGLDEGKKEEYEKFFSAAMKKFKINSPADLKSDEEKKKFFDYVDKNYKSGSEKKTGKEDPSEKDKEKIGEALQKQYELKMQSMKDAVQKVWEASDRENIEMKKARSVKAKPGKTMTGDDMSVVTLNPEIKG